MKIDEAVSKIKHLKYKALQGAIIVHDTYSDDYELFNESALTALGMAIASLEAWEKVKAEIEDEKIDFDINIGMEKYYNNAIDDVLQIIDEHLQEIKNE